MDFEIPEMLVNRLLDRIAHDSALARQLGEHGVMRGRTIVSSTLFDEDALGALADCCREHGNRSLMLQVSALRDILADPETRKIGKLEVLVPGLIAYLSHEVIDGWLYRRHKDGVLLPWLVYNIRVMNPVEPAKPYVVLDLIANTMRSTGAEAMDDSRNRRADMTNAIVIYPHDIVDKTIPEVLADQGYFKENPDLKHEYESDARRFLALQPQYGKQFLVKNAAFVPAEKRRLEFINLKKGVSSKCVNDEETLDRQFEMRAGSQFWADHGIWSAFEKIPLHCYLYMFHLELHQNLWVHVQNIEEYRYKPELREKLILPEEHRDLIDILTTDMNALMEDIVEGKSGGTTILCKGAPGLGKTLTAEVYAEVVGKPLYRVHSGQLGTTAASVQASLTEILRRAARWDSIMLLDEADVYIRQRDNDLEHNAIVAEFLRTLEYFSGLLFMTTNRIDDVDDAILSRCIAIIQYDVPQKDDAIRLWQSLARQFKVELQDALIQELVAAFPGATGRDIKELLKLTAKYCKIRKLPFTLDAFRHCAVFRGVSS